MRTALAMCACLLALSTSSGQGRPHPFPHAGVTSVPVLGAWRYVGTAPPGFVRTGNTVARLTLWPRQGRLRALVTTGKHRYTSEAQYSTVQRRLLLALHTARGVVRLQAALALGGARMIGVWSDAHGDDGGFVLLRTKT